jgi:hypothetical protein
MRIIEVTQTIRSTEDPLLIGNVFHATTPENFNKIIRENQILSNEKLSLESPYGRRENGFFKKRNCVSFFDYRDHKDESFKNHLYDCTIEQIYTEENDAVAILFLNKKFYKDLISWRLWKEQATLSEQVVPYVEAGLPGPLPLDQIESIVLYKQDAEQRRKMLDFLLEL